MRTGLLYLILLVLGIRAAAMGQFENMPGLEVPGTEEFGKTGNQEPEEKPKKTEEKKPEEEPNEEPEEEPHNELVIRWLNQEYETVRCFSEGLAAVQNQAGKWGFISLDGREVIACQYSHVWDFKEGLAGVGQNGKCGYINQQGEEVIPLQYDYIDASEYLDDISFYEGIATVGTWSQGYFYIDSTGERINQEQYLWAGNFSGGLAPVMTHDQKVIYIDKQGKTVLDNDYFAGRPFTEGLAAVADQQGNRSYIDRTGRVVLPCTFQDELQDENEIVLFMPFSEGLAMIVCDDTIGFMDKKGKLAIPLRKYSEALPFSEGLAAVAVFWQDGANRDRCSWGYINRRGEEVIPMQYETYVSEMTNIGLLEYNSFHNGLAVVIKDEEMAYIDKTGKEIVPFGQFSELTRFSDGYAAVRDGERWGILKNPLKKYQ